MDTEEIAVWLADETDYPTSIREACPRCEGEGSIVIGQRLTQRGLLRHIGVRYSHFVAMPKTVDNMPFNTVRTMAERFGWTLSDTVEVLEQLLNKIHSDDRGGE